MVRRYAARLGTEVAIPARTTGWRGWNELDGWDGGRMGFCARGPLARPFLDLNTFTDSIVLQGSTRCVYFLQG